MIRFEGMSPEVMEAMCTPMHQILPAPAPPAPSSYQYQNVHPSHHQHPYQNSHSHQNVPSQHNSHPHQIPHQNSHRREGTLFLGSMSAALDRDLLHTHRITHLVQVLDVPWLPIPATSHSNTTSTTLTTTSTSTKVISTSNPDPNSSGGNGGNEFSCLRIDILDKPSADLRPHLEGACRYIASSLRGGHNVLVHCQQGVSRSPAIVIAYLIHTLHMSYDDAYALVRLRRPCVAPNPGFVAALRAWEGRWRGVNGSGDGNNPSVGAGSGEGANARGGAPVLRRTSSEYTTHAPPQMVRGMSYSGTGTSSSSGAPNFSLNLNLPNRGKGRR
ncbi:protein-tyrosine phosphatase-like protein [Hygrophoropsis aurantiaca]|uniref:Protein-tyrosine phosphatase-like protein n=1 Tax=Hygrophoropsis aurantiaca TaxID=72124 RepID=A0ACB7ZVD9_9AGAM|nr:protein-tyrosine phosphatase-like protein [Hygrophoropsis aurantiaca]